MENGTWQLDVIRPWALVLLVLLPLVVYYRRRSLVHFARWQQGLSLAVRVLLVVVLVVSLCGIKITRRSDEQYLVLAADESQSTLGQADGRAEAFTLAEQPHVILPFAGGVGDEATAQGSDIAGAIAAARAEIPTGYVPGIVLFSDGNQTTGDGLAAARAAGCPISVVPLPGQPKHEVYISAVETPGQVRRGEPFYVEVVVYSTGGNEGAVKLLRGSQLVGERQVHLVEGENRLRFRRSIAARPVATFTAKLDGFKDTVAENNQAAGVVFTTGKPRVLLVESRPVLAEHLAKALAGEDIEVDVRPPEQMPGSLGDLQGYELLILSNVPATSLPAERMELVDRYVSDFGGGLIVVGGERAFTPGGYHGTRIEEVLPVICEPKKDKPKPRLAMVLVLDQSGSMKEGGAIELAKQAARQAVDKLAPSDQVGIVAFEDRSRWACQILPCSDKQQVLRQINTITAGGGTNMYPAIEKAYLALNEAFAELKHMIVLTDGLSHPGDFDSLARAIAGSEITVSTVAVGEEAAQEVLRDIARRGGGNFYYCADPVDIPQIFALETISAGKVGITEEPFIAQVVNSTDVLADIDFGRVPTLLGFVETQPKPSSQLILASKDGDPLLVSWRRGRGTSVAFTSDIQSRWAAAWLRWPEFGKFWAQLVRYAMRKDESRDFSLQIARSNNRAAVMLDAVSPDGRLLNAAAVTLKVVDPDGKTSKCQLEQVAPGRYRAEFPTAKAGTYYLEVTLRYNGALIYRQRRGLVVGFPDELRLRPANRELLRSIAEATGGRYDPRPADIFAASDRTAPRTVRLWPYLIALASLIFLGDLTLKRIELGRKGGRGKAEGGKGKSDMVRNALLAAVAVMTGSSLCCPAAELREEIQWRVAPSVTVLADRTGLPAGDTLEQIVAAAAESSASVDRAEPAQKSRAVVEGELFPLRYRRTIRRYFDLIRSRP